MPKLDQRVPPAPHTKQKINQFIFNKKERLMEKLKEEKSKCEIYPENLNLPNDIKDFIANNIQENFLFIGNLFKSNNLFYKKYGIYLIRKQLTLEANPPIKELYESMKSESVYYPSFLSNDLKDLLKKIFVKNPKNRFTIEQIISHPWVSK